MQDCETVGLATEAQAHEGGGNRCFRSCREVSCKPRYGWSGMLLVSKKEQEGNGHEKGGSR